MDELVDQIIKVFFLKNPLFWILWLLVIIFLIGGKKLIGFAGEFWVKDALKKLDKSSYKIINDVMLEINDKTHQIDHIIVSKYGIFIIETKQYNGYITGNEYDKNWLIHYGKDKKYYINNPMHQNYGHVLAVKEILNIEEDKIIPIICIPSKAKLNVKTKTPIARYNTLVNIIHSHNEIKIENIEEIYNNLIKLNIADKNKRKAHVKNVKIIVKEKKINSVNKCPKCGNELIEKNGKYGKFIGCSNYPKCRFIKK